MNKIPRNIPCDECGSETYILENEGWWCSKPGCSCAKEVHTDTIEKPTAICPRCGSPEVEANTPRTKYACGSSDYDQRPGTFTGQCADTIESLRADLATAIAAENRSREIIYAMADALDPLPGEHNIDAAKRVQAERDELRDALLNLYNYEARRSSPDTAWDSAMMTQARKALSRTSEEGK